ncbi:hypothetical protein [Streptomyces decoyicus]|uniref:hypothetical protein n=1 Tax=Streptomyces decoyicus TaxID=249567 RepID=UPI00382485AE
MSTLPTSATSDAQPQENPDRTTSVPATPPAPAALTPQDVLADGQEHAEFNGVLVRKGSIAAFIGNAKALENLEPGTSEHEAVAQQIRDLKPALDALELFDVVEIKNPDVAALLAS